MQVKGTSLVILRTIFCCCCFFFLSGSVKGAVSNRERGSRYSADALLTPVDRPNLPNAWSSWGVSSWNRCTYILSRDGWRHGSPPPPRLMYHIYAAMLVILDFMPTIIFPVSPKSKVRKRANFWRQMGPFELLGVYNQEDLPLFLSGDSRRKGWGVMRVFSWFFGAI